MSCCDRSTSLLGEPVDKTAADAAKVRLVELAEQGELSQF